MPRKKTHADAVSEAILPEESLDVVHEAPPAREMSVRDRVKLAHALATVVEDSDVVKALSSKPFGEYVLALFTEAVERRLNELTGGTSVEESAKASEVLETLEQAETVIIRLLQGVQRTVQGKSLQVQSQRATLRPSTSEDEFERPGSRPGNKPDYYVPEEGDLA